MIPSGEAARLRAALADREAALRRLRHGIRNELQLLSSLLSLRLREVDDPVAQRELARCHRQIAALGLVHQQEIDDAGTIAADSCLAGLVALYQGGLRRADPAMAVTLQAAPVRWRADRAVRVVLILEALITVAQRLEIPTLALSLARDDDRDGPRARLELIHGGPCPEPSETDAGLAMASAVAEQLGGRLELTPASGGGTRAVLWLPLLREEAADVDAKPS